MRRLKIPILASCLVLLGWMLMPSARADEWDEKTELTFSQPVEIPGLVLPAGKYVFKLADSLSDRDIVEVYNANMSHLYTTVIAIPDYRLEPKGKTVVTFEERKAGAPEALKAWFYPGMNYGVEFVYPKVRAVELAQATQQHVMSTPVAPKAAEVKTAPVQAIQPSGKEVPMAAVHQAPPPAPAPAPAQTAMATPENLPKTGSDMPLIGLIGIIALGGAFTLWRLSKRFA